MQRFRIVLVAGLIVLSGLGMISPAVAQADSYTTQELEQAVESARLPYEPMVVAPEDRRPYLPLLVRSDWELHSIDELKQSGIRFQTNLEQYRATWPKSLRLVTIDEALNEAQLTSQDDSDAELRSLTAADVQ